LFNVNLIIGAALNETLAKREIAKSKGQHFRNSKFIIIHKFLSAQYNIMQQQLQQQLQQQQQQLQQELQQHSVLHV